MQLLGFVMATVKQIQIICKFIYFLIIVFGLFGQTWMEGRLLWWKLRATHLVIATPLALSTWNKKFI